MLVSTRRMQFWRLWRKFFVQNPKIVCSESKELSNFKTFFDKKNLQKQRSWLVEGNFYSPAENSVLEIPNVLPKFRKLVAKSPKNEY